MFFVYNHVFIEFEISLKNCWMVLQELGTNLLNMLICQLEFFPLAADLPGAVAKFLKANSLRP